MFVQPNNGIKSNNNYKQASIYFKKFVTFCGGTLKKFAQEIFKDFYYLYKDL